MLRRAFAGVVRLVSVIAGRLGYGFYRLADGFGTALSRFINHVALGGSTHQTTSAHCHINDDLKRLRVVIDFVAWPIEADHCAKAYQRDVENAQRTLEVYEARRGDTPPNISAPDRAGSGGILHG